MSISACAARAWISRWRRRRARTRRPARAAGVRAARCPVHRSPRRIRPPRPTSPARVRRPGPTRLRDPTRRDPSRTDSDRRAGRDPADRSVLTLLTATVAAAAPITRDGAREQAERELDRAVYDEAKPSLIMRAFDKIVDFVRDLLDKASSATPGGAFGLLTIAILLAVGIFVAYRLGPLRRPHTAVAGLDAPVAVTAAQLRSRAEAFAADQQWAEAVRARLRAVVRALEDRTLIEPRLGRTATEVARDAGAVAPPLRSALDAAASTFGEVWYGGRQASAADYRVIVDLDDALARYRPAP